MVLSSGFKPTARQVGHAIGLAIGAMPIREFSGAGGDETLRDAGISRARYESEFLLLSSAAAMHAIEAAGLLAVDENSAAAGLYDWLREFPEEMRGFLLENIENSVEAYAVAFNSDTKVSLGINELSFIEEEFGERLLALGENNEKRGRACVLLSLSASKILWAAQFKTARAMLQESGLDGVAQ